MSRRAARKSLICRANNRRGICEVLRFVYDEIVDLDKDKRERITELLVDAFEMAKKMTDRLIYYKTTYNDTTGHNGKNIEVLGGAKERSKQRGLRKHR